jgi:hypothetical protein
VGVPRPPSREENDDVKMERKRLWQMRRRALLGLGALLLFCCFAAGVM